MANKTIKESIRDLFLALGGNPSALADNADTSDFIDDLESAIKAGALPAVTADDNGKVLAVVDTTTGAVTFTFTPDAESGT